jgi:hypothetical protein
LGSTLQPFAKGAALTLEFEPCHFMRMGQHSAIFRQGEQHLCLSPVTKEKGKNYAAVKTTPHIN